FKGNLLRTMRRVVDAVQSGGHATPGYKARIDWRADVTLMAERYVSETRYDALNRPTQLVAPHSGRPGSTVKVIQPVYNDASLLEQVDVWLDCASVPDGLVDPDVSAPSAVGVARIDYDAKAQRTRIDYKNGVSTRYEYDVETLRLVHLQTDAAAARLQDLR